MCEGFISEISACVLFDECVFTAFIPLPLAGCATSFLVTVVTSTSWSAIDMVESTNTTESGAHMPSPSRCSHCVGSRNEGTRITSQTLTFKIYLLLLQQVLSSLHLLLPGLSSVTFLWNDDGNPRCSTNMMFSTFCFILLPHKNKQKKMMNRK